jgi:hypothetical protein
MNDQSTSLWSSALSPAVNCTLVLSSSQIITKYSLVSSWQPHIGLSWSQKSYLKILHRCKVSALWGRGNTKWCIQSLWLLLPNIVMHRARICYEFLGFNPTAWTATVFSVVGMRRWGLHFPPALSTPSIAQKNTSVSMVTICHGNQTSRSRWPLPSLSQLTADLPGPSNFFSDFVPGYVSGYDITTRWAHRFCVPAPAST